MARSSLRLKKLLLIKGVKSPHKNKCFFLANFDLLSGFFCYRCYYPHRLGDSLSPVCVIFNRPGVAGAVL